MVANVMEWRKLRYVPVEDDKGCLVGLITTRKLLRYFTHRERPDAPERDMVQVKDIMIDAPRTISPCTTIKDAMYVMRGEKVGCLPVIKNRELVGIITEMDFLRVSGRLLERLK